MLWRRYSVEGVEFVVVAHCQLDVARKDAHLLVALAGVVRQLEHLGLAWSVVVRCARCPISSRQNDHDRMQRAS